MGKIADITGIYHDSEYYFVCTPVVSFGPWSLSSGSLQGIATDYLDEWISLSHPVDDAIPATLARSQDWAKIYNIYADILLATNFVPQEV